MELANKIMGKLSRIIKNDLLRHGMILTIATVLAGALNYLFQILMGNYLTLTEYGDFGSLLGFLSMLLISAQGVRYCAMGYSSRLQPPMRDAFIRKFIGKIGIMAIIIAFLIMLISPLLVDFLRIDDYTLIGLLAVTTALELVTAVYFGMIGGMQRFKSVGTLSILSSCFKLGLGLGFVILGWGVIGALTGVMLSSLAILIIMMAAFTPKKTDEEYDESLREIVRYFAPSILVAIIFTAPGNIDIILVKNLFSSADAGVYTSITVLGKILIFLPMGVAGAMFPKVAGQRCKNLMTWKLLKSTFIYSTAITILGAAMFVFFPSEILNLIFPKNLGQGSDLLPWYGLMIIFFSISLICANYCLALRDMMFIKVFSIMTLLEVIVIYLMASDMLSVILIMIVINAIAAVFGIIFAWSGTDITAPEH